MHERSDVSGSKAEDEMEARSCIEYAPHAPSCFMQIIPTMQSGPLIDAGSVFCDRPGALTHDPDCRVTLPGTPLNIFLQQNLE